MTTPERRSPQRQRLACTATSALLALLVSTAAARAQERGLRTGETTESASSSRLYHSLTAVIIGIDHYPRLDDSSQLNRAVADARGVAQVLEDLYPFDRIITLYDEQATRAAITKVLQGDLVKCQPDDGVLIYFAGHGITHRTAQGDIGFLVPYDGSLALDEQYRNISMLQFKAEIAPMIPARHVLLIADACFGGLLLDTRSSPMAPSHRLEYLRAITREPVRQIITAGGKHETVLDGGEQGHSVFTGRLIAALREVEDFVTARELGGMLQRQVFGDAAARGHTQRPLVGEVYGTGDFAFVPDEAKRQGRSAGEARRLEASVAELESQLAEARAQRDEARTRELERERLLRQNAMALARLRETSAADLLAASQRASAEAATHEAATALRMAALRNEAERLQLALAAERTGPLSLAGAQTELRTLRAAIARVEQACEAELPLQTQAIEARYAPRIRELEIEPPREAMFETAAEYRDRLEARRRQAESLRLEMAERTAETEQRLARELTDHRTPMDRRLQQLLEAEIQLGPRDLGLTLTRHVPEHNAFAVDVTLLRPPPEAGRPYELRLSADWTMEVEVPREDAREFFARPDLLLADAAVSVTPAGAARLRRFALQAPDGRLFPACNLQDVNPVVMPFAWIPQGDFVMGSPPGEAGRREDEWPRVAAVPHGLWAGCSEVTQAQWESAMGDNPSHTPGRQLPVERVTWESCQSFVTRLGARLHSASLWPPATNVSPPVVRMPTETEWEYICRSGTTTRFFYGDDEAGLELVGWWSGNSGGTTHEVASLAPNDFGLYDTHGNVWEWCLAEEATAGASPSAQVLRGGGWRSQERECRSASRGHPPAGRSAGESYRADDLGLRVVIVMAGTASPGDRPGSR